MGRKRHGAKNLGPYYRFAVVLLEPFLTIMTRRERKNTEILKRDYPPNDGIIVVVNHMSWFDPMNVCHVLWDAGRPPRFLAKDALFKAPGIGQILTGAGQIPVYRASGNPASAIGAAVKAVQAGECVVIYPEGTMTRDPDLWPMAGKSGAAMLALKSGAPVIPMAQWGPQEIMRPYAKEFHLLPRKKMHTLVGEPVDLDDLRDVQVTKEVLNTATDRIVDAITALLAQLRDEQPPTERLDFKAWKAALAEQNERKNDSER
ncbi:MAG: 1-acyl-sn-glycerol-3-phosphate acyltransferase [Actinobacteria bacterium]|nr:1-acyl-sn-glycerol-3-phosphate acyltransferase [Actinomycetota bacterium]